MVHHGTSLVLIVEGLCLVHDLIVLFNAGSSSLYLETTGNLCIHCLVSEEILFWLLWLILVDLLMVPGTLVIDFWWFVHDNCVLLINANHFFGMNYLETVLVEWVSLDAFHQVALTCEHSALYRMVTLQSFRLRHHFHLLPFKFFVLLISLVKLLMKHPVLIGEAFTGALHLILHLVHLLVHTLDLGLKDAFVLLLHRLELFTELV